MNFIRWFFSNTKKQVIEQHVNFYDKFIELEKKYENLLEKIKHLEDENMEMKHLLGEVTSNIDAVDARIDILTEEKWID